MRLLLIAAAAACALVAGSAQAAIIKVSETGVVSQGQDGSGLFGTAGADLVGKSYTASILVDTSKGYYQSGVHYYNLPPNGDFIVYGRTSAVFNDIDKSSIGITGSISVDGAEKSIDGTTGGKDYFDLESYHLGFNSLDSEVSGGGSNLSFDFNEYAVPPSDLYSSDPILAPTSFSYDFPLGEPYQLLSSSFVSGGTNLQLYATHYAYEVVDPTGGPSVFVSSAPEPALWLLMLAGVGVLGGLLRLQGWQHRQSVSVG